MMIIKKKTLRDFKIINFSISNAFDWCKNRCFLDQVARATS